MSLAYLDPGNLEADLQGGAYTGYQLLWILLLAHVIGFFMQVLAARLGAVSGRHLAQHCRERYPRVVAYFLWIMTELAIIGADIQEVVGTAIALHVLLGVPMWAGVLITAADTFTFLAVHYFKGVRVIEILICSFILVMMCCFFVNFGIISPPASDLFAGFLPSNTASYATLQAVAIIGAVIMPHNIYLHSALVTEKGVDRTKSEEVRQANHYFMVDSAIALTVSFFVNLALLASFASGFFSPTCAEQDMGCLVGLEDPNADTCYNSSGMRGVCSVIGLEEAGGALQSLMGSYAKYIFALGLFAAGQASTLTGTFAGQYVMSGFMRFNIAIWLRTLLTRSIALGPALIIALFQASIPSLSQASEWLNVLQSVQLPFAVLPLLHFVRQDALMGEFRLKSATQQIILWFISLAIIGTNFYLVSSHITPLEPGWYVWFVLTLVSVGYLYLCYRCIDSDVSELVSFFIGKFKSPSSPTSEQLE
jgi:natural resistance-associated macrophage protein